MTKVLKKSLERKLIVSDRVEKAYQESLKEKKRIYSGKDKPSQVLKRALSK